MFTTTPDSKAEQWRSPGSTAPPIPSATIRWRRRFTLVVHDVGGPIGLGYALDHTERVSQLLVLNTFCWPLRGPFAEAHARHLPQRLAPLAAPEDRHGLFAFAEQVFAGAGHFVQEEEPAGVIRALRRLLAT